MRMIFLTLPVRDLGAARDFFTELGFEFNPEFSDATAACLVLEQNAFVMLVVADRFRDFVNAEISDATRATEVLIGMSAGSRQQVDETVARALAAGGKPWKPTVDEGHTYGGSFQDLDGHVWELLYIDAQ